MEKETGVYMHCFFQKLFCFIDTSKLILLCHFIQFLNFLVKSLKKTNSKKAASHALHTFQLNVMCYLFFLQLYTFQYKLMTIWFGKNNWKNAWRQPKGLQQFFLIQDGVTEWRFVSEKMLKTLDSGLKLFFFKKVIGVSHSFLYNPQSFLTSKVSSIPL